MRAQHPCAGRSNKPTPYASSQFLHITKPMNKLQTIAALQTLASEQKTLAKLYEDISEEMHEPTLSDEPTMGERFNSNVAALTAAIGHISGASPG